MVGHSTTDYMPPERVVVRLWSNATRQGDGCIVSNYSKNAAGYAQIGWCVNRHRVVWLAHRIAYASTNGPIPVGMTVDHVCRNRACINPEHLRMVSHSENCRDNAQARRTHCPLGHPYSEGNTFITKRGHRQCIACKKRWR